MKLRPEIKAQAKVNFSKQYGISLGALLLYYVIVSAASGITFGLGVFLLMPPMLVGYSYFNMKIYRDQPGDIGEMFNAGFNDYGKSLGGVLWMELFIFLWSLLFIIPGIIKALSYFMTPYLLSDCPKVRPTDALKLSMRMTQGYKGEIFVMCLSFIGWWLLSMITAGLVWIFFAGPYFNASMAGLYLELKQNALEKGIVTPAELGLA
jgi:uncharacterized membrane protein